MFLDLSIIPVRCGSGAVVLLIPLRALSETDAVLCTPTYNTHICDTCSLFNLPLTYNSPFSSLLIPSHRISPLPTPFSPCRAPVSLSPSYNDTVGPGSCEVFTTPPTPNSPEGEPWIVFHGWEKGKAGYDKGGKRMLRMYPFTDMPELPGVV